MGHHKAWSLRLNLTQRRKTYQFRTQGGLTEHLLFLDSMDGGAWPLLVGGLPCQVNSGNERDLQLLFSGIYVQVDFALYRRTAGANVDGGGMRP